jgi:predicted outer membrane protein
MLHRIPRSVRWVLLVALLGAVTVSVVQSWVSSAPGTGGWQQTQWGPLGPADRDLLIKVRQAGLWEAPTGQQMAQQATNQAVKETGQHLAEQHAVLDQIDRDVADKLGVSLPSRPSDQQIGWMNQITNTTGTDYDKVAVQIVRQAHGIVLPIIAQVRVGTRNELVRQFADTAFQYVTGHIAMLEATGLVDYSQLPQSPSPGLFSGATTPADMIVPIIVFVACAGAAIGLLVTLRRGRARKKAAAAPATGAALATLHAQPVVSIPEPRDPPGRRRRALTAGDDPVSATGGHRRRRSGDPASTVGSAHSASGAFRRGDSGAFRRDDSGEFRYVDAPAAPTRTRRSGGDSGGWPVGGTATAVSDSGPLPVVDGTGPIEAVRPSRGGADSGSYRRATTDSGRYRAPDPGRRRSSDSGRYRQADGASATSPSGGFRFDDLLDDRSSDTGRNRSPRSTTRGHNR